VLTSFAAEGALGSMVSLSLIRELGPVLTAIMIAGRAGSAMAAEIGVMRISEQLDALEVMDIDPVAFLISPRLAACIIIFPLMTSIFDTVGIIGGALAGTLLLDGNAGIYFYRVQASVDLSDVAGGLVKSLFFGIIVAAVSCYKGFFTHLRTDSAGPAAVNNATTSAVVLSCILVLMFDYIITSLLM
jgi:phospholipid/cholesterol/gamma-HCH transport system permease protein